MANEIERARLKLMLPGYSRARANVLPALLDVLKGAAHLREDALRDLTYYRARATGGMLVGSPTLNPSQANAVERETRAVDAALAALRKELGDAE